MKKYYIYLITSQSVPILWVDIPDNLKQDFCDLINTCIELAAQGTIVYIENNIVKTKEGTHNVNSSNRLER